jgi:hypothetical protein
MSKTASALYSELESNRQVYLQRARDCSELTIPTIVPPEGNSNATEYVTPHQGVGARGVNNISAKLLLALFPPNAPFFRLMVDPYKLKIMGGNENLKTELEKALGDIERAVMKEIEAQALRVPMFEAIKHLIVAGNALLYFPEEGGMRVFRLENYVVKRDAFGNVLAIVTKECIAYAALPEEAKKLVSRGVEESKRDEYYGMSSEDEIDLFTCVKLEDDKWEIHQEINGELVPGSEGSYSKDKNPFIPLRYSRVDNEDYGRGLVEEYLGDLRSLEGLTKAVVEGSAAASKVLFLVDPTGTTKAKQLAEARNGQFVPGRVTDVNCLQLQKYGDFRVAKEVMVEIQQRLSFAFLLNTAIQRDAERVTAQEIRFMAQELETALGGAYSILSQEFQLPLVTRIMDRMAKKGNLPKMPKNDLVRPVVVTGVEALGRGNDLTRLDLFLTGLAQMFGPEAVAQYINIPDYLRRRATSLGIETEGLIKSEEQLQSESQMQMGQNMVEKLGPQAIKSYTDSAITQQETMNNQGGQ